jgi:RND family efflux transporter MFP subunit
MKTFKVTLILALILGVIIAGLVHNKVQSDMKTKRPDLLSAFPVTAATVAREKLSDNLSLVGTIVGNNDVAIVSETQGRVISVYAKVGDYRSAGSVIVQVDDELRQANFKAAEANYEKTKKDLSRNEELYKDKTISESQIESSRLAFQSAEAQYIVARRQLSDTKITTPISGVVTARLVDLGNYVQPGMAIANVVDISKLKIKVNVAERDAFKLKAGDKVEVTTDVYAGITLDAGIDNISAKADEAHTYPVEMVLQNPKDHPLKAGMFCRVSFISINDAASLSISRDALVGSIKKPQVYVIESGKAKLRDVVVGQSVGTKLEILKGLNEGETIVTNGQNNLQDDVPVTIVK